ncbi:helix-turn-helix transcriptional regulator [Streptomyces sp. WI04-05B]|uniref:helix-turn-helix transcriptional regulator n=1 Tax=Streptomyces TaxID=1883 RepID=UPI0029AB35CC|nr:MULTISPECIES: helix-turn-helix domain-containing protein [unclassified Streptomyces]MDX2542753.1 helix-turn-helix domain-containing protein [Streptomyces sp. WI04-05B]MDX2588297.1 helix-turn-helix domain-containing protein [Streptomyces sp. WI04-05A]MDX3747426.1 helix-turn-helix domain-containing protein [Streptomyces sp. AK08-02]
MRGVPESHTGWTFLTNHSRVLAAIAENPTVRIRDIAARCRLTERAVQKIVSDLETAGYLTHTRQGRSNAYRIETGTILRHPAEEGLSVAELLSLLARHDAEHGDSRHELQSTAPHARSPEDDR